jgi:hypothetical protein
MRSGRQPVLRYFTLVVISAAVIGCGGDPDAVKAVPAAGTITFNGKPIESGTIGFIPGVGRPASGKIKDGHFTMTTYSENDGAIPGKHRVVVRSTKQIPSPTGGDPTITYLVPARFSIPGDSFVDVEVPPGGSTNLDIKIEEIVRSHSR